MQFAQWIEENRALLTGRRSLDAEITDMFSPEVEILDSVLENRCDDEDNITQRLLLFLLPTRLVRVTMTYVGKAAAAGHIETTVTTFPLAAVTVVERKTKAYPSRDAYRRTVEEYEFHFSANTGLEVLTLPPADERMDRDVKFDYVRVARAMFSKHLNS